MPIEPVLLRLISLVLQKKILFSLSQRYPCRPKKRATQKKDGLCISPWNRLMLQSSFSEIPIHGVTAYTITLKLKLLHQYSWLHILSPHYEPCTGYTDVLGCAFIQLDINLASFPQVYWQGFPTNRITVLKPSTMQPATGNLVLKSRDSPISCITASSQQLVLSLWKRLMWLVWGLSRTLWSFFSRSEYIKYYWGKGEIPTADREDKSLKLRDSDSILLFPRVRCEPSQETFLWNNFYNG